MVNRKRMSSYAESVVFPKPDYCKPLSAISKSIFSRYGYRLGFLSNLKYHRYLFNTKIKFHKHLDSKYELDTLDYISDDEVEGLSRISYSAETIRPILYGKKFCKYRNIYLSYDLGVESCNKK